MTNPATATHTPRQLAEILTAHDMIAHSDANARGAKFAGWVRFDHISEYVDIAPADVIAIITDCAENMTSPTHKVDHIKGSAFMAYRVS